MFAMFFFAFILSTAKAFLISILNLFTSIIICLISFVRLKTDGCFTGYTLTVAKTYILLYRWSQ